ncbi:Argininosuccinate synthase [uncultured archaeon]|nr:Argininosuccinate synthase [uncultured archaeon]
METLLERAREMSAEYKGVKKVAVAHSGGLDSAVIAHLLSKSGFIVHPVVVNIGQHSDFLRIEKNAKSMFSECHVVDMRQEFAESIFRALKSNFGAYGGPNTGGISRPIIALALVETARKIGCTAIAHGSSGVGNDHLNMENSLRVLAPDIRIMAPVRDLDMRRDEAIAYAKKEKLGTNLPRAEKFSADENLSGRVIRQGIAVDPSEPAPEEAYKWTVSPSKAPDRPAEVILEFSDGIPAAAVINGKKVTGGVAMLESLNEIGGKHGVGRLDSLDDKIVGLKVREVYEMPAFLILLAAHRELEAITLTTRELDAKMRMDITWCQLVHDGGWYTRLRRSLDAFTDETERVVDGIVTIELYKGGISVKSRKSAHALYNARLSGRGKDGVFSQKEARHFAKLYSLQEIIAYMLDSGRK